MLPAAGQNPAPAPCSSGLQPPGPKRKAGGGCRASTQALGGKQPSPCQGRKEAEACCEHHRFVRRHQRKTTCWGLPPFPRNVPARLRASQSSRVPHIPTGSAHLHRKPPWGSGDRLLHTAAGVTVCETCRQQQPHGPSGGHAATAPRDPIRAPSAPTAPSAVLSPKPSPGTYWGTAGSAQAPGAQQLWMQPSFPPPSGAAGGDGAGAHTQHRAGGSDAWAAQRAQGMVLASHL